MTAEASTAAPARLALHVSLGVLAVLYLLPTLGVLLSALKTTAEISAGALWALPEALWLGNFAELLANPRIWTYLYSTARPPDVNGYWQAQTPFYPPFAGLGYGLPISRLYSRSFGGARPDLWLPGTTAVGPSAAPQSSM